MQTVQIKAAPTYIIYTDRLTKCALVICTLQRNFVVSLRVVKRRTICSMATENTNRSARSVLLNPALKETLYAPICVQS